MKSILIVANSTHGGGAENSMMLLHKEFIARDVVSQFIAINDMDDNLVFESPNVQSIGRKWADGFSKTYAAFKKFKMLVEGSNPELLIANCELAELFLAFLPLGSTKIVVVEHTSRPWNNRRILGLAVRSLLEIKGAIWVTVNSQNLRIWPFAKTATHIPNLIPGVQKSSILTSKSDVVFVGRIREEKSPKIVIDASLESEMRVLLFGEGNQARPLKSLYQGNKLVHFMGYVTNPWSHISSDSLVVVPSKFEGDGMVVVEALQNGNPLLLRNNRDLRRFKLAEQNYFEDYDELLERLFQFKENSNSLRVDLKRRMKILETRNTDTLTKRWLSLIMEVLEP